MNPFSAPESRPIMHHTLPQLVVAFGIVAASAFTHAALAEPADDSSRRLDSPAGGWTLSVAPDGTIQRLDMTFGDKRINVPWRPQGDKARGPAWAGVELAPVPGDDMRFAGRSGDAEYGLAYRDDAGRLTIDASIRNHGSAPIVAQPHVRLTLGMNQEMKDPRTYFTTFFPTLLRCEQTHFWGYFQTPNGQVLAIASPDAVASWAHGYQGNGHRITTSHLDLLHALPLPPRHPQAISALAAGAAQTWRIILQPVAKLDDVPAAVATLCDAPALSLDRTTAASGETVELTVHRPGSEVPVLTMTDAGGKAWPLPAPRMGGGAVRYTFSAPEAPGEYTIQAVADDKRTEAVLCVRKPWGWYLEQARAEALRMQQKPMMHREGWLGFFNAYWAERYAPDPARLAETEEKFQAFFAAMVDPATGHFYKDRPTWPDRPQNSAWMLGLLTLRAAVTRDVEHLQRAADWADDFIKRFQKPDGAFTHGKNSYGALTLGTKFLADLVRLEQEHDAVAVAGNGRFAAPIARHLAAIDRAVANLEKVKDLGHTEGEPTYEDNQAGSVWSLLALHALTTDDASRKARQLATSLEVRGRHECLTQALIPDGRMRGGTLRWWEAQYDVLTSPSMMNSPHGWTMRSQFGAIYLYLLTGEERFLNLACNAMGACAQAIDQETGRLRWAFVPDPYVEARQFVPDPERPGQGKHVPTIVGEQWLPMISDWWRVPEGKVAAMRSQGWSCDNDVHEHFRWLAEQFVPNAFVLEREDGTLRAWNCRAERAGEMLEIVPAEPVVSRVHLNLREGRRVSVRFAKESFDERVEPGMRWIGPGGAFVVPVAAAVAEPERAQDAGPRRPNVLFIIADDASRHFGESYGCDWVKTPHIDRLAAEGIVFDNFYVATSKCSPSRAAILTGRNPWQLEDAANHYPTFPPRFMAFPEACAAAGIACGSAGKVWEPGTALTAEGKPRNFGLRAVTGKDAGAGLASFLTRRDKDKPFFYWFGSRRPHRNYKRDSGLAAGKQPTDIDRVPAIWPDTDVIRRDMLDYAAAIESFDGEVGSLLAALDTAGETANTIVVVTSDNGMPFPRVKGHTFDEAHHMPLVVRWPAGIARPGRRETALLSGIDFAPTFLELFGVDGRAGGMEPQTGQSFGDLLRGEPTRERPFVIIGRERNNAFARPGTPSGLGYPARGIRQGDFLYVHNFAPDRWPCGNPELKLLDTDDGPTKQAIVAAGPNDPHWQLCFGKRPADELYYLATDPDCVHNLAAEPAQAERLELLRRTLMAELTRQEDPRVLGRGDEFDNYISPRKERPR